MPATTTEYETHELFNHEFGTANTVTPTEAIPDRKSIGLDVVVYSKKDNSNWFFTEGTKSVIKVHKNELDNAMKEKYVNNLLNTKGISKEEIDTIKSFLIEYIGEQAQEREIELSQKSKEKIANIMIFVGNEFAKQR